MTKADAIQLANTAAPHHPGATLFFITTDEKVFTTVSEAVENAILLSPGNPEVIELNADELDVKPAEITSDDTASEKVAQLRIEALDTAEKKIKYLKEEILKLDDEEEITEENQAQKLHVADLKRQLEEAELELKNLQ